MSITSWWIPVRAHRGIRSRPVQTPSWFVPDVSARCDWKNGGSCRTNSFASEGEYCGYRDTVTLSTPEPTSTACTDTGTDFARTRVSILVGRNVAATIAGFLGSRWL